MTYTAAAITYRLQDAAQEAVKAHFEERFGTVQQVLYATNARDILDGNFSDILHAECEEGAYEEFAALDTQAQLEVIRDAVDEVHEQVAAAAEAWADLA